MREVLFLLSSLTMGGSERKTVKIVNSLVNRGINCHLLYLNGPHSLRSLVKENVKLQCLGRSRRIDLPCLKGYRDYIIEHRIETVCCMNLYPVFIHRFGLVGLKQKPKTLVSVNSTFSYSLKDKILMPFYAALLRGNARIIFGSQFQKNLWACRHRINPILGEVIYNGVDVDYFHSQVHSESRPEIRQQIGIKDHEIVLGMVASLTPEKAHSDLLKAAKEIIGKGINLKVLLVGDGPEREALTRFAMALKIEDRVVFFGEVLDVRPALACMDIFALTSISKETFSNAALEAMAMCKPVILSDISGASEMVNSGVNGFLYPPRNIDALVDNIQNIVQKHLYDVMGREGRKIVENRFTLEGMVSQYEKSILM